MNRKITALILMSAVLGMTGTFACAQYGEGAQPSQTSDYAGSRTSGVTAYNQGVIALNNNEFDKALGYFKHALKQDKNNADTLAMIGYTQVKLGKPDDAITSLKAALKIQPRSAKAREFLGEAYIRAAVQEMDVLSSYGDGGQDQLQKLSLYFTNTYENLVKCKVCQ